MAIIAIIDYRLRSIMRLVGVIGNAITAVIDSHFNYRLNSDTLLQLIFVLWQKLIQIQSKEEKKKKLLKTFN